MWILHLYWFGFCGSKPEIRGEISEIDLFIPYSHYMLSLIIANKGQKHLKKFLIDHYCKRTSNNVLM